VFHIFGFSLFKFNLANFYLLSMKEIEILRAFFLLIGFPLRYAKRQRKTLTNMTSLGTTAVIESPPAK
jgi:hypothetical protein